MHVIATAGHVDHGKSALVRALTRSAVADRAPAMESARGRIAGPALGQVEAIAVSSVTGAALGELRAAIGRLIRRLTPPAPAADVRLWIDRSFTITGHGTVVTGTLAAGTLRVGDQLLTTPGHRLPRLRPL